MKLLVIANPFPIVGGGGKRSLQILKNYQKFDVEVQLIFPPQGILDTITQVKRDHEETSSLFNIIDELKNSGIDIHPDSLKYLNEAIRERKIDHQTGLDLMSFLKGSLAFVTNHYLVSKYFRNYCSNTINYDMVYSHHETWDSAYLAYLHANATNKPLAILFQLEPFRPYKDILLKYVQQNSFNIQKNLNIIPIITRNITTKQVYRKIFSSKINPHILSVSSAPLMNAGLNNLHYHQVRPANAFDPVLLSFRKKVSAKSDYAIFFGRIRREKGVLELPIIWRGVVNRIPGLHLYVFGTQSNVTINLKDMIHNCNLDNTIIHMGYAPSIQLFEMISKARVFIYPSHEDSFALSILESLAIGTPVIAYDIPAIKDVYMGLNAVKIVSEGDHQGFCEEIITCMRQSDQEYMQLIDDVKLNLFLKLHSSWERVAKDEFEILTLIERN